MAAGYIERIAELASGFRQNERNLALYFPDFETAPWGGSLNRVFGPPVGVTDASWPTYPRLFELMRGAGEHQQYDPSDLRMEHVFTIDLRGIRLVGAPPDARAMLLFLSNTTYHYAHHNGNGDSSVVFLSEDDIARGLYSGAIPSRSQNRWTRRFSLRRIDVPGDVFDDDGDPTSLSSQLHDAIWQAPARLGGCPIWVREPMDPRDLSPLPVRRPQPHVGINARNSFVMQFERRFADVNLGNQGVMYVSGVGAYYQAFE